MLKIKNIDVVNAYELLINLSLSFKNSRLRSKFCRLLANHNDNIYVPARQELINHFGIETEDGKHVVPFDKLEEFQNEIKILEYEYFTLELNESNKEMLLNLNEILHNEELFNNLSGDNAIIHDKLCDEFERIEELYNK